MIKNKRLLPLTNGLKKGRTCPALTIRVHSVQITPAYEHSILSLLWPFPINSRLFTKLPIYFDALNISVFLFCATLFKTDLNAAPLVGMYSGPLYFLLLFLRALSRLGSLLHTGHSQGWFLNYK